MTVIQLERGNLTATVHPEVGGALTSLALEGRDLLRPASAETIAARNALDTACYPLVPFSNRIRNGRLRFQGREYRLEPNMLPHPHPLHGHAYRGAWEVIEAGTTSALLRFRYQGSDFPSAYAATERFTLTEAGLSIALGVENVGQEAMPAGLGLHPFFVKPPDTEYQAEVDGVWLMAGGDGIPTERIAVPEPWNFAQSRPLGDVVLDHCFTGWQRRTALITWPGAKLRMRLTAEGPTDHLVVYVPQGQGFFCVEPVTNMNDAFNRADAGEEGTGTVILQPGERLEFTMGLTVERL